MGIAGAAIVCDFLQVDCFDHDKPLLPILTLLVPAGAAAVGAAAGALAGRLRAPVWALACVLVLLAAGSAIGSLVEFTAWLGWRYGLILGARDGFAFAGGASIALAPVLFMVWRLARVRPESMASRSHHLAAWCGAGIAVDIAALLAREARSLAHPHCPQGPELGTQSFLLATLAGALVSLGAAAAVAGFWARARKVCLAPLEPCDAIDGPARVDFGVGEGTWSPSVEATPYRDRLRVRALFLGSPIETMRSLTLDLVVAGACAILVVGSVAMALESARPVPVRLEDDTPVWSSNAVHTETQEPPHFGGVLPELPLQRVPDGRYLYAPVFRPPLPDARGWWLLHALPGARRCVSKGIASGLESKSHAPAYLFLEMSIRPDGEVDGAHVVAPRGWSTPVVRCVEAVARRTPWAPPPERRVNESITLDATPG